MTIPLHLGRLVTRRTFGYRVRYVRTAEGARRYGVPIGSPIPSGKKVKPSSGASGGSRGKRSSGTSTPTATTRPRIVRTEAGARRYGVPVGSPVPLGKKVAKRDAPGQTTIPTPQALPTIDEGRVARNAASITDAVRNRGGKTPGQAARDELTRLYPDASPTDLDHAQRAATRAVAQQMMGDLDNSYSPQGRGLQVAVRALERKQAARDMKPGDALTAAREVIGDPTRMGKSDTSKLITKDDIAQDGGPGEETMRKVEAIRNMGASISAEVDRRIAADPNLAPGEARRQVLSELRPLGPGPNGALPFSWGAGMDGPDNAGWRKAVEDAQRVYPTAWIDANRSYRGDRAFEVTRTQSRPGYNMLRHSMDISTGTDQDYVRDQILHEMGHSMEAAAPHLMAAERAWLMDRVTRSGTVGSREFDQPSEIYEGTGERGYRDDLGNHYMGRVYDNHPRGPHEVLTMGAETVLGSGRRNDVDPDMEHFILGMWAAL